MKSGLRNLLASIVAALAGLAVMLGLVAAFGYPPLTVGRGFLQACFGSTDRFFALLLVGCPLLLTGLAVCIAFRCGVLNIGAEGQFLLGALAAVWAGVHMADWPRWLAIVAVLLAAAAAGAAWAGLAAWLKLSRGVQEVLSTILLNFIALQVVAIAVHGPLTDPHSASGDSTASIAAAARLPLISTSSGLHIGIALAGLAALATWLLLSHSVAGLRIRIVGANPLAARLAGLPVTRYAAASFLLSGALAGLAGGIELSGNTYYLTANYGGGYGYTAIAVALLARLSPIGAIAAALFFAMIDCGARGLQSVDLPGLGSFPTALTFAAQGVVVLIVVLLAGAPRRTGET